MVRAVDGAPGVHNAGVAGRPRGPWDEGDGQILCLVRPRAGGEQVIPGDDDI